MKRAIKGAVAAGLTVHEVIATPEGVRLICGNGDQVKASKGKSWDEVLK